MKKYFLLWSRVLILGLVLSLIINLNITTAYAIADPPQLGSNGLVLMDAKTGQVLYGKEADKQFYPASTTKVLTAMVVLDEVDDLSELVTVSRNCPAADGTKVGLREGDQYSVQELLTALILFSGNDCANALAEHVSGSIEAFAELMNKKAKSIGANNSNFKNPSGLPDPEHVTTPRDLAIIMKEAIKDPDFMNISTTRYLELSPSVIDGHVLSVSNHNYILLPNSKYYYEYAVTAKKGYTEAAKFTNVAVAEKDGLTLVASFLNGENIDVVYDDVKKIFDYGFDNFKSIKLFSEGDEVDSFTLEDGTNIPLLASSDMYYTVSNDDAENVNYKLDYNIATDYNKKSLNRGDKIVNAKVLINGKEIGNVTLASGISREYKSAIEKITEPEESINIIYTVLKITLAILLVILIYLVLTRKQRKFKRRHKKSIELMKKAKNKR